MVSRLEKDLQMVCVFTTSKCYLSPSRAWRSLGAVRLRNRCGRNPTCSNVAGRNPWKKHGEMAHPRRVACFSQPSIKNNIKCRSKYMNISQSHSTKGLSLKDYLNRAMFKNHLHPLNLKQHSKYIKQSILYIYI